MDVARSIEFSRRIASGSPTTKLPCPACAATLNAANLERHVETKHADSPRPADRGEPGMLRGHDRWARSVVVRLMVAWAVGSSVAFALTTQPAPATLIAIGSVFAVLFLLLVGSLAGWPRARLRLGDGQIRLSAGFGLRRCAVRLPVELVSGQLIHRVDISLTERTNSTWTVDKKFGHYLRLLDGKKSITVGAPKAGGLAKHWDACAWTAGKRRRRWDITLDRDSMVDLQYHLAEHGVLTPRTPERR